ncbi:hypothetical protein HDU98_005007 [Podochytrium sp. JEL0797]|nr:hypothetical protein HDU98_005007 [Podochytrium sp. JEL0797]
MTLTLHLRTPSRIYLPPLQNVSCVASVAYTRVAVVQVSSLAIDVDSSVVELPQVTVQAVNPTTLSTSSPSLMGSIAGVIGVMAGSGGGGGEVELTGWTVGGGVPLWVQQVIEGVEVRMEGGIVVGMLTQLFLQVA